MSVLVDTSAWSLALRRDRVPDLPVVRLLRQTLEQGEALLVGCILQEVLQGFHEPARTRRLVEALSHVPLLALRREDYVFAAHVHNVCRSKGLQVSTLDAQIAAAAINHRCRLLTADRDFEGIARHFDLRLA